MTIPDRTQLFKDHVPPWYRAHGRAFPWRGTGDPYRTLVAERMLHRTIARQVVPVYDAFLARYPTIDDLATADPAAVGALLAPLGLSWRVASFIPMARRIVDDHDGQVPRTMDDLLALPGVGPYVASAVLAFAYHEPVAVVDTNTIRVAGRYLIGIAWVGDQRKRKDVRAAVSSLLDTRHAAEANYGILDLGATICVVRDPSCPHCPVALGCMLGTQRLGLPLPEVVAGDQPNESTRRVKRMISS